MMKRHVSSLAREPLVQFLVVGALLFGAQSAVGQVQPDPSPEAFRPVIITAAQIETAAKEQENRSKRPVSVQEREAIAETLVREEIYYREAKALGLDRGDSIIRRRLVQKMRFLAEDGYASAQPTDEELRAFVAKTPRRYMRPHRVTFEHVFFSAARRAEHRADALDFLSRLEGSKPVRGGDPFTHGGTIRSASEDSVRRMFGRGFSDALLAQPEGTWSDPISSAFGSHVVLIRKLAREGQRPLAEVRDAATRDWRRAQGASQRGSAYAKMRARYTVEIEEPSR